MAEYIDIDYPLLFKDIHNREIRVTVRDLLKANHAECVLADVAPVRHGRWERHFSRPCVYADLFWHCSVCGYKNAESFADAYHHYCPNCGAKMDGEA